MPLQPTQLFEGAAELGIFFILAWMFRRKKFDGQIFGLYLILYGIARYFLEFIRDDPGRGSVFGGIMSGHAAYLHLSGPRRRPDLVAAAHDEGRTGASRARRPLESDCRFFLPVTNADLQKDADE